MTTDKAKKILLTFIRKDKIGMSFEDKWGNFGKRIFNQAATGRDIEFSKWHKKDGDLMIFAYLHEIGHHKTANAKHSRFAGEYAAWNWAIDAHIRRLGKNISRKQAVYMIRCLKTYAYGKNSSHNFWCPISDLRR